MGDYKYKQINKLLFLKLECIDLIDCIYKYLLPPKKKSLIDNIKSCVKIKKLDNIISYYQKEQIYNGNVLECEISRCTLCLGIYNIRYIKEISYDNTCFHRSVYKLLNIGRNYNIVSDDLLNINNYFIHNCKN